MKKLLVTLGVVFALIGCSSAKIEEMNIQIATLENRISEAEKTSGDLRDDLALLKIETIDLEKNVEMLNEKVEQMKKALDE